MKALRHSLTAQITAAITLVSVLTILLLGMLMDSRLGGELREETELLLLSNLALLRDDLAAAGNDPAVLPRLVTRAGRRTPRLHLEVVEERGAALLARSPQFDVPPQALPREVLPAQLLPSDPTRRQMDRLREQLGDATVIWQAADGGRYRLLRARLLLPATQERPARGLLATLAVETTPSRALRDRNRRELAIALCAAGVLSALVGLGIARRIVVSVRRFGATASRVGVSDLHERMPLEGAPAEMAESTRAFNRMLDRLQDSFERLSAFSSDLAHDLRTPLGNLMGEAQVALSRPRTADEYRAVLESAVEEYERLSRMITNMLFLARAENQPAPAAHWVDLDQALQRVAGYFELLAEERGVVLRMDMQSPDGVPARAWADESMLVRALGNLVSNALQHTPPGSAIRLRARVASDGSCTLEVANDGPPIPAEHQPHLFERFYRVDASRQGSAAGSGLGLAIVHSIMDMHGGTVAVDSGAGRPTTFTLRFPGSPLT